MKAYLALCIAVVGFFGCNAPASPDTADGAITSPAARVFFEDASILFRVDSTAQDVVWTSSLDGEIGNGRQVCARLSEGIHTVEVFSGSGRLDTIELIIQPVVFTPGTYRSVLLRQAKNTLLLPAGEFAPVVYPLGNQSFYSGLVPEGKTTSYVSCPDISVDPFLEQKSFSLSMDIAAPPLADSGVRRNVSKNREIYDIGDTRSFIVADTTGHNQQGYTVDAVLVSTNAMYLWIDADSVIDEAVLESLSNQAEAIIMPRVHALWGDVWADIDENGCISVLITPLINEQERAIGFFNPGDLYSYEDDPSSAYYNPVSNHMDIVYLADPFLDPEVFAYSVPSLLATLAHESTHLIVYSNKTFFPEEAGWDDPPREELFLDEGLAHLSESLVGYGASGGNLAFFSRYLDNTPKYSARFADIGGAQDSVGKRGLMSAFLSWLFWQAGGAEWSLDDPGMITDTGGIAFLRRLMHSGLTGWENISSSAGQLADALFMQWITDIDLQDRGVMAKDDIPVDPFTSEPLGISAFYGGLEINGTIYPLNGPVRFTLDDQVNTAPYTAVWYEAFTMPEKAEINLQGDADAGYVVARFFM